MLKRIISMYSSADFSVEKQIDGWIDRVLSCGIPEILEDLPDPHKRPPSLEKLVELVAYTLEYHRSPYADERPVILGIPDDEKHLMDRLKLGPVEPWPGVRLEHFPSQESRVDVTPETVFDSDRRVEMGKFILEQRPAPALTVNDALNVFRFLRNLSPSHPLRSQVVFFSMADTSSEDFENVIRGFVDAGASRLKTSEYEERFEADLKQHFGATEPGKNPKEMREEFFRSRNISLAEWHKVVDWYISPDGVVSFRLSVQDDCRIKTNRNMIYRGDNRADFGTAGASVGGQQLLTAAGTGIGVGMSERDVVPPGFMTILDPKVMEKFTRNRAPGRDDISDIVDKVVDRLKELNGRFPYGQHVAISNLGFNMRTALAYTVERLARDPERPMVRMNVMDSPPDRILHTLLIYIASRILEKKGFQPKVFELAVGDNLGPVYKHMADRHPFVRLYNPREGLCKTTDITLRLSGGYANVAKGQIPPEAFALGLGVLDEALAVSIFLKKRMAVCGVGQPQGTVKQASESARSWLEHIFRVSNETPEKQICSFFSWMNSETEEFKDMVTGTPEELEARMEAIRSNGAFFQLTPDALVSTGSASAHLQSLWRFEQLDWLCYMTVKKVFANDVLKEKLAEVGITEFRQAVNELAPMYGINDPITDERFAELEMRDRGPEVDGNASDPTVRSKSVETVVTRRRDVTDGQKTFSTQQKAAKIAQKMEGQGVNVTAQLLLAIEEGVGAGSVASLESDGQLVMDDLDKRRKELDAYLGLQGDQGSEAVEVEEAIELNTAARNRELADRESPARVVDESLEGGPLASNPDPDPTQASSPPHDVEEVEDHDMGDAAHEPSGGVVSGVVASVYRALSGTPRVSDSSKAEATTRGNKRVVRHHESPPTQVAHLSDGGRLGLKRDDQPPTQRERERRVYRTQRSGSQNKVPTAGDVLRHERALSDESDKRPFSAQPSVRRVGGTVVPWQFPFEDIDSSGQQGSSGHAPLTGRRHRLMKRGMAGYGKDFMYHGARRNAMQRTGAYR